MELDYQKLNKISKIYGDAYYLLDTQQFEKNFIELKEEFKKFYSNFNIAYSYKTNYIPQLCKIINKLDGYAEVVSDMEMELALKIGVEPQKIIWNGPYKNYEKVEELLIKGGIVNIDSFYEMAIIEKISKENLEKILNIGIRCNFDVEDGVTSRFGFDVDGSEFKEILSSIKKLKNVKLVSLQCHFAARSIEVWRNKVKGMLQLLDKLDFIPEILDLGGGLFGKMDESLKQQFNTKIPNYSEYALEIGKVVANYFKNKDKKPQLVIEPGSALVGDCMKFVAKVVNIKTVRGKSIATVLGSIYNINPTLNTKNPPLNIYTKSENRNKYHNLDFGGFTCIESDYLYRGYEGELTVGDIVVFGNVGSYSVVLKPPFILPNFPIIDITNTQEIKLIKEQESFDDIFQTYKF